MPITTYKRNMEALQRREHEIFETLKLLNAFSFVVIGGYAVNAYTLPRFSIDCDLVLKDEQELAKIKKILMEEKYAETVEGEEIYYGNFKRYEKVLGPGFKVSLDLMIKEVIDRMTKAVFSAEWVFQNSQLQVLRGKTMVGELKLKIISLDALVVMKFISGRATDIRDVFMLAPHIHHPPWVQQEISQRYDFDQGFQKIKEKILSKQFKDGLQGVFGYVEEKTFEKHIKAVLNLGN
ncbi:nucleotidyl transferase AbiEii/AbiGii toxin family protein [Candidatus Woesearchaeota archaeon]|nr:nucleotidyl transferase AbiEii/AbiGii toxin family protein [Candidatus Woesearchaeota archaeon]